MGVGEVEASGETKPIVECNATCQAENKDVVEVDAQGKDQDVS